MSTFYGGEQLIKTQVLMGATSTTPQTIFTCPVGEYARVTIERISSSQNTVLIVGGTESNSVLTRAFVYSWGGDLILGHQDQLDNVWQPLYVTAGEKIFIITGGVAAYRIIVQRYKNPS